MTKRVVLKRHFSFCAECVHGYVYVCVCTAVCMSVCACSLLIGIHYQVFARTVLLYADLAGLLLVDIAVLRVIVQVGIDW